MERGIPSPRKKISREGEGGSSLGRGRQFINYPRCRLTEEGRRMGRFSLVCPSIPVRIVSSGQSGDARAPDTEVAFDINVVLLSPLKSNPSAPDATAPFSPYPAVFVPAVLLG
ncbi:hypothetical protein JTE90_025682 [Oedothorax gibbosus]|uniref:Uncharacterized protein n=1 Tax=Oedothorax gibbosus TaxID=931172 RepID=A0AAV6UDA6_9ARAC|nr:hypothetical protein JTE90_025682 [Oedothorax gibbosus]